MKQRTLIVSQILLQGFGEGNSSVMFQKAPLMQIAAITLALRVQVAVEEPDPRKLQTRHKTRHLLCDDRPPIESVA